MVRRSLLHFLLACSLIPVPSSLLYANSVWDAVEAGHITWSNAETNWLDNGDFVITYKTGEGTLHLPGFARVWALAVGGGGSGGGGWTLKSYGGGAGGGAGGYLENKNLLLAGGDYSITVGAGGNSVENVTTASLGNPGGDTSFRAPDTSQVLGAIAAGGGAGATQMAGGDGGSGGGGSAAFNRKKPIPYSGGATTQAAPGLGNKGGDCGGFYNVGAGGGGAGGEGAPVDQESTAGNGGAGKSSDIDGETKWYAAGGGGGCSIEGGVAGTGGSGVGGNGGTVDGPVAAGAGLNGTGSGGGGGMIGGTSGRGGDGVVIVRISLVVDGPLEKPQYFEAPYTGEKIVAAVGIPNVLKVTGEFEATDVREETYKYREELAEGFKWTDGTSDPVDAEWRIVPGTNSIPVPLVTSVPYDGKNHIAAELPAEAKFRFTEGSVTCATNAGTYTYTAELLDKANWRWADGSVTNQTFSWTIDPRDITPQPLPTGAVYGGTNVVAVTNNPNYAFADGSVTSATNAGVYTVVFELADPANNRWPDGSVTNLTYAWTIARLPIDYPEPRHSPGAPDWNFVYTNDTTHVAATNSPCYSFNGTTTSAQNRGDYFFIATLNDNWCWKDPVEPLAPYSRVWWILQATNEITSLTIGDWKLGEPAKTPSITARFGATTVEYSYGKSPSGTEWSPDPPKTNGVFYVRAFIPEEPEYGNWSSAVRTKRFLVYKSFGELFTDYVDFDFTDYEGDPLDDCRIRVKISEELIKGFSYARCAGQDNLAFMDITDGEDGSPLPYAVETWNEEGESYVWVRLPKIDTRPGYKQTKIRMYWRLRDGMEGPGPSPEDVYQAKEQIDGTFLKHGFVWRDGVKQNYWVTEPDLTPREWDAGKEPGEVTPGVPAVGTCMSVCVRQFDGAQALTNALPAAAGRYTITFTVEEEGFSTLEKRIDFAILGHSDEPSVGPTEDGRILLANDDSRGDWGDTSVTNQSYWIAQLDYYHGQLITNSFNVVTNGYDRKGRPIVVTNIVTSTLYPTNATYWAHSGESTYRADLLPFMLTNSVHTLETTNEIASLCGGKRLWHLNQIRIGSPYTTSLDDTETRNRLPWAETSCAISSNGVAFSRKEIGNMMLRNTTEAAIYSPCYTNGIGTIYFDAVNFWAKSTVAAECDPANHRLVVEVATCVTNENGEVIRDAAGNKLPPTDVNVQDVGEHAVEVWSADGTSCVTNFVAYSNENFYARAKWEPVKATRVKIIGTASVTPLGASETIELGITEGGSHENFYRIYAPCTLREPARFRIRRISAVPGHEVEGDRDSYGQILLDNIIASKPTMRADMESYGRLDPEKTGPSVLGQECATTVPYPAITDRDIRGRARAIYTTGGATDVDTNSFVTGVNFHYRWRYLNQNPDGASDWREPITMRRAGDMIVTDAPLEHPGAEGDIEYWYETFLQTPFYSYVDYSGTDHRLNGTDGRPYYTEELSVVTNDFAHHPTFAALGVEVLPSLGTNWFFRLRNGRDTASSATMVITEGALAGEYPMYLAEDNTWRCMLPVPKDAEGTCRFYFRVNDRQEPGTTEIARNTAFLSPEGDLAAFPAKGKLDEGSNVPRSFVIDHASTHLECRFNDLYNTYAMTRAEYQTFNEWSDAHSSVKGGKADFYASFTDTNGVNVTDMKTYPAPIPLWPLYENTSTNWNEAFILADYNDPGFPKEEIFAAHATPNGWGADYIAFVSESLGGTLGKKGSEYLPYPAKSGMAGKLIGQGKGRLSFTLADRPDGIERLTFKARIGQAIEFDAFNYSLPATAIRAKDYTFTALASMSHLITDNNKELDMAANGALSLVAYLDPKRGCYELRVERIEQGTRVMMSLWKWHLVNGALTPTCLVKRRMDGRQLWTNNSNNPSSLSEDDANKSNPQYRLMFISAETTAGGTVVHGGLSYDAQLPYKSSGEQSFNKMANGYYGVCYTDTASDRFKFGSYGLGAKDCPAEFLLPRRADTPVTTNITLYAKNTGDYEFLVGRTDANARWFRTDENKNKDIGVAPADLDWSDVEDLAGDEYGSLWALTPNRIEFYTNTWIRSGNFPKYHQGLRMPTDLTQDLIVQMAPVERPNNWTTVGTNTVAGYGFTSCEMPFYRKGKYNVRLTTGSEAVDVVVDDVAQTKWMGEDSAGIDYASEDFIYTQIHVVTNTAAGRLEAELVPARAHATRPLSIRSPVLNGLGKITFAYAGADPNAEVWVQMATNRVDYDTLSGANGYNASVRSVEDGEQQEVGEWVTLAKYTYANADPELALGASGTKTRYVGIHDRKGNPLTGVFRLFVPTNLVTATDAMTKEQLDAGGKDRGKISITSLTVWDEPALDERSWRGWNLRTAGDEKDLEGRMYLADMAIEGGGNGLVCALNNSVRDVVTDDEQKVRTANPTIWSPTLGSFTNAAGEVTQALVGEVTFKARVYDAAVQVAPAKVTLYGSTSSVGDRWDRLADFTISTPYFTNCSWKAGAESYAALRFEVSDPSARTTNPKTDRVILDEITICERVQPTLSFVYAWPFRDGLNGDLPVANVGDPSQQPLAGENWGVQTKLTLQQLGDEVDLDRGLVVTLAYYDGVPAKGDWGYANWKDRKTGEVRLEPVGDPEELVFRSVASSPASVLPPSPDAGTVVQFMLRAKYYDRGGIPYETTMQTWTQPSWFHPVDYNRTYGGAGAFAAYTILDRISPGRAWINEVNWNNGSKSVTHTSSKVVNNQFIELCVPSGVDLTGWKVRVTNLSEAQLTLATLGSHGVREKKITDHAVNGYEFLLLESPETNAGGGIRWPDGTPAETDGTWNQDSISTVSGGTLSYANPFGFELVRPSGVIEHTFTIDGTNEWGTARYEATNLLERLNAADGSPRRFYAGRELEKNENGSDPATKGTTFGSSGVTGADPAPGVEGTWTHGLDFTPGGLNKGQVIPEGWFLAPNGTNAWVTFKVVGDNLTQRIGEDTGRTALVILPQGQTTNVIYSAAPWHEVATITVNGVTNAVHRTGTWSYPFKVPEGSGTMVSVVATEGVDARLDDEKFGLKGQRYANAVVKWLQDKWPDKDPDDIRFARYGHLRTFPATRLMTLIEMYWLDIPPFNSEGSAFEPTEEMDPLSGEWVFRGGFTDYKPHSVIRDRSWGKVTNSVFKVKLMITNEWDNTVYAPKTLQGLNYESSAKGNYTGGWTSVAFRIYGMLDVNREGGFNQGFKPFREFVFGPDSFGAKGAVGTPTQGNTPGTPGEFETVIELLDPFSKGSIGYEYGWWRWPNSTSCFFKWQVDSTNNTPVTVEMLKPRSVYGE